MIYTNIAITKGSQIIESAKRERERRETSEYKNYPKKLFVFERTGLLRNKEEIEAFLKSHPNISEVTYLAYVEQFQRYDASFQGEQSHGDQYELRPGDDFKWTCVNEPLVRKKKGINADTLVNVIGLGDFSMATRIEDSYHGYFVDDKSGSIDNHLTGIFLRAATEYDHTYNPLPPGLPWRWRINYPHVSIATINLPKFTQEIVETGRETGAEIYLYREQSLV